MVFDTFIKHLRGLAKPGDASYDRVYYFLESMATIKSTIILCELAHESELSQGNSHAEELLVELFDCLLSSIT